MSTVFSLNKGKRSRSASNESNNSFVKNVTSRVTGLLPSTITKWFSSPSSSEANGSAPAADATDSSTEDEALDTPISSQPPIKRMRLTNIPSSTPANLNSQYSLTDVNNLTESKEYENIEPNTSYSSIQSPPGKNTFRRETNYVSTPLRAVVETSVVEEPRDREQNYKIQSAVSQIGRSIEMKRKSLFRSDSSSSQVTSERASVNKYLHKVRDPKPCFKPSLLGSPFYSGRTAYGGAAASYYMNEPNVKQRKVAVVNETPDSNNTLSEAARRVMDLLEHYSSPIIETRRIPSKSKNTFNNSVTLNDTAKPNLDASSLSSQLETINSYKKQELHVPSVATFLKIKHRSRLMDSTAAARQIMASQSSTAPDFSPYPAKNPKETSDKPTLKHTTKIKSRLTRPRRGEATDIETETVAPVNLPTGVLKIDKDNMPKFTFGNLPFKEIETSKASSKSAVAVPENVPPLFSGKRETNALRKNSKSSDNSESTDSTFKFSSPLRISKDGSPSGSPEGGFSFGSPERKLDAAVKKSDIKQIVTSDIKLPVSSKENQWKCNDCWVFNKPDTMSCICCGGRKIQEPTDVPTKCTLCKLNKRQDHVDKCENCEKVQLNKVDVANKLPTTTGAKKWKCDVCWIQNDDDAEKCACCQSTKPNKTARTEDLGVQNKQNSPASNNVLKQKSGWKCDICWITNKSDLNACAACGGENPNAKKSLSMTAPPQTVSATEATLDKVVKTQSSKWECPSCLVRNDNDKQKCACCETPKPGSTKDSGKAKFNFGTTNNTFKFGIDSKKNEDAPKVTLKKDENETNNNNLLLTPSYSFGIPAKSTSLPSSDTTSAFSFVVPKSTDSTIAKVSTSAAGFRLHTARPNVETKESEQEVPKAEIQNPSGQAKPASSFAYFGSPSPLSPQAEKPTASALSPVQEVKNTAISISLATTVAAAPEAPKSAFTFSSDSGIKLGTNMFATIEKSSNTPALSFTSTPSTTVRPNMFSKNDSNNQPTLFTNTMTASTTTIAAAASPIFSFGVNTAGNQPQAAPTKPTFNFTFGSNKPDASSFKPTFGAAGDNTQSGSFALGTGSSAPSAMHGITQLQSSNQLTNVSSNTALPTANLFGGQEENMWSSPAMNNTINIFSPPSTSAAVQKPPAFSFGTSTPFTATSVNQTPTFGNTQGNAVPAFGAGPVSVAPAFGSAPVSGPPVFGAPTGGVLTFGAPAGGAASAFTNSPPPAFTNSAPPAFTNTAPSAFTNCAPSAFTNNAAPAFGSQSGSSGTPMFGNNAPTSAIPTFGASATGGTSVPNFGANSSSTNIFGMPSQTMNSQQPMFSNTASSGAVGGIFGSASQSSGMFGAGSAPTPAFGTPNIGSASPFGATSPPSIPNFETSSMTPAPPPAFNFGSSQSSGVFGFGQQQQPTGVYNFGSAPGGTPSVQFNMGSFTQPAGGAAASPVVRRMRKAVRRTQR